MTHVPNSSRNREVIYILDPPRTRSNGFGITGFVLSILGVFTCGLLAPFGLLFSLLGLLRAPRGFGLAGTAISGGVLAMIAGAIYVSTHEDVARHHHQVQHRRQAETRTTLSKAQMLIEHFRSEHDGQHPDGITGNKLVLDLSDAWQNGVRYEPADDRYTLRSAGPDRHFFTGDDLVISQTSPLIVTADTGRIDIEPSAGPSNEASAESAAAN